jgi:protein-ribulosamine 3-kinase
VRVPRPLCHGVAGAHAYLALEYIELQHPQDAAQERLGIGLAALHRATRTCFGWHRDNTIGATPQHNSPGSDWIEFWRTYRLGFQIDLAKRQEPGRRLAAIAERLLAELPAFFSGYTPTASLLHGDLWAGNAAQTPAQEPVIFDPAVYAGDREADLAMTELFGGFSACFYSAYHDAWPLDAGYAVRRDLYNVYHVLNHANLFGGDYWRRSARLIESLLSHIR